MLTLVRSVGEAVVIPSLGVRIRVESMNHGKVCIVVQFDGSTIQVSGADGGVSFKSQNEDVLVLYRRHGSSKCDLSLGCDERHLILREELLKEKP